MVFPHEIGFDPERPGDALAQVPARAAVFALRGETGEPYLNRTADLRRRLQKLLTPAPAQSRRLQLAGMVRKIAWVETASEFGAQWTLYRAASLIYGDRAAKRLHLRTPSFLRMAMKNRYPRLYATQAITYNAAADLFGPFPSRNAAERYGEQLLDLFLLRRCFQDLDPDPEFPGCIYSEMKKCLAPCFAGCTDERYDEEARAVHAFLNTGGESLLKELSAERERASEALDFEAAAQVHARYEKVKDVAALAPEAARALAAQKAVLVQASAEADCVELYLLERGALVGPVQFSTLGMRLPNEASGSSSLFAHPAMIAPVPLGGGVDAVETADARLEKALIALGEMWKTPGKQELCDHQALFARWYFRPQAKREGEVCFARDGVLPVKALLRACARVFVASVSGAVV